MSRFHRIQTGAIALLVFGFFVGGGACDANDVPCYPAVLWGVVVTVEGLELGTYDVHVKHEDGVWVSCESGGYPGQCAQGIVGHVQVRVIAMDGRIETRDVDIEGDACGLLFRAQLFRPSS